jgi:hypothetical protein
MEKGSEKNNCFAEDSNEYGKQAPPPVKPPEGGSSRSTTPWPDRWTMSQRRSSLSDPMSENMQ